MIDERIIFCIDLKSFYASVECISRNLDPFKTNLVVADVERGPGSIILAVSPLLKSKGVPSRLRINELPKNLKEIIFAKPRMQLYIDYSIKILKIYLNFFSIDDIHIYSIDEVFIDYTPYQKLYKKSPLEFAKFLLKEIYLKTNITATCGIGNNMFMAKVAMDFEAKHKKSNLAYWKKEDIQNKLQQITNLTDVWGIGKKIALRLNKLGIYSIKELAAVDPFILEKEFGIIGIELYNHAHGHDEAIISKKELINKQKSISIGQTLEKNYNASQILIILKEMSEEIAYKLRQKNKVFKTIHLHIGYTYNSLKLGFSRQISLSNYSDDEKVIYTNLLSIFKKYYDGSLIRKVGISVSNLTSKEFVIISFLDNEKIKEKEEKINKCLDEIKQKYHKGAVFKAHSLLNDATTLKRNKLIGGHNAE